MPNFKMGSLPLEMLCGPFQAQPWIPLGWFRRKKQKHTLWLFNNI